MHTLQYTLNKQLLSLTVALVWCFTSDDRKRTSDGDGFHGDMKRPRTDKPPATLRVLVRNRDAGGIIGKVCGSVTL